MSESPYSPSSSKRPAAVPITASAFSFSIDSPAQKRRKALLNAGLMSKPQGVTNRRTSEVITGKAKRDEAPVASSSKMAFDPSSLVTPKKTMFQTLNSLPSPLSFGRPSSTIKVSADSGHKLSRVLDEASPLRVIGDDNPEATLQGTSLPGARTGMMEEIGRRQREVEVKDMEDEGIGVSPRKGRVLKWTGRGPMPPSIQLASLLRSRDSSLILFYSSLQRRLQNKSDPTGTSALPNLIRNAPMRVHPVSYLPGSTQNCTILTCRLKSEAAQHILAQQKTDSDDSTYDGDQHVLGVENNRPPGLVLLVLTSLPPSCIRVGIDPRLMVSKLKDPDRRDSAWEIGIWPPWDTSSIASASIETEVTQIRDVVPSNVREDLEGTGAGGEDGPEDKRKPPEIPLIFASRYVVVDRSS